jgi:MFS family permease
MRSADRRARLASQVVFFTVGLLVGGWFSRMAQFKAELALTYSQLGSVLLAQAVGLLVSMQVAGVATARFGSKPVTRLFAFLAPWLYVLLVVAPGLWPAIAVMFVAGFVAGVLDVAMNAQGVEIQQAMGRPVLHSMHAAWGWARWREPPRVRWRPERPGRCGTTSPRWRSW